MSSDGDDLLALARRGELSEADDRRLRELLASSPESRAVYEAGRAFDLEAPVLPGDDQRVARIERRVQKRLRRSSRVPQSGWIVRACLAAALVTGGAVGAVELTRRTSTPVAKAPEPTPAPPAPSAAHTSHRGAIQAVETSPEPDVPALPEPIATPPTPPVRVAVKPAPMIETPTITPDGGVIEDTAPVEEITALGLFSAANHARVAGDIKEAIRISKQLEDQFPTTREAISTHLSLAMLYLQEQDGVASLDEFQRYRAVATAATMPEAIWGESQALHVLGRVAEERAALEELLKSYPQSAYSAAARKRLAGLP